MQITPILLGILAGFSFWFGQVCQTKVIELKIRSLYKNFIDDTKDHEDRLINIGVELVYEFLFKKPPK